MKHDKDVKVDSLKAIYDMAIKKMLADKKSGKKQAKDDDDDDDDNDMPMAAKQGSLTITVGGM